MDPEGGGVSEPAQLDLEDAIAAKVAPDVELFLDGKVELRKGDCRDVLRAIPDNSIDAAVTDPPYALVSIAKRFGKEGAAPAKSNGRTGAYARASAGFMGKTWDTGETAFAVEFWQEVLRVLKPGGHVVAFSGTRTYHRMTCAIEDAGFEIRDQIGWCFGSGFPKSHNIGNGWGTALKPAWEPICLARKPLIGTVVENVMTYGTGALNIDGCRVEASDNKTFDRMPGDRARDQYRTGTTGASRSTDTGRFPANLIHDGSEEVLAGFPDAGGGDNRGSGNGRRPGGFGNVGHASGDGDPCSTLYADSGSAARFFYTAKADSSDRLGSKHPTVKPVDLMQWLCRLVCRKGGTILDPFAGTGTTGEAAWREGMNAILIEREPEYQADIARRMELAVNPTKRAAVAKTKNKLDDPNDLPLFAGEKS